MAVNLSMPRSLRFSELLSCQGHDTDNTRSKLWFKRCSLFSCFAIFITCYECHSRSVTSLTSLWNLHCWWLPVWRGCCFHINSFTSFCCLLWMSTRAVWLSATFGRWKAWLGVFPALTKSLSGAEYYSSTPIIVCYNIVKVKWWGWRFLEEQNNDNV